MTNTNSRSEVATLAGGCFWCLEAVFDHLKGVTDVVSGYSGGSIPNPSYNAVTSGRTGHAEVVQIRYNPDVITFGDLLDVFFTIHDPTTLNRQGNDIGTQYRSAIYYHTPEQQQVAQQKINDLTNAGLWRDPIVTEVTAFDQFYAAEDYHQEYFANNPLQPYCMVIVAPKVAKARKAFTERWMK